jgi:hypothetical protein
MFSGAKSLFEAAVSGSFEHLDSFAFIVDFQKGTDIVGFGDYDAARVYLRHLVILGFFLDGFDGRNRHSRFG